MNMLGVAVLDFVDHLRAITKGWRIEPMIWDGNSKADYVKSMVNPPRGVSLTNFFADWMTKWKDTICFIRIKIKGKRLRFIQCELIEDHLTLFYWAGEGWKQNQIGHKWFRVSRGEYDYQRCTVYQLFKINRIKKGTRNRGRKSPGKSNVIQIDRVELNDPGSAARVAKIAVATLTKSLDWDCHNSRRRRAIVLDGEDFNYDALCSCVMQIEYMS